MSIFPILVARRMLQYGCGLSLVEQIRQIITERPEQEAEVLWMRLRGDSYQEIAEVSGLNKGSAWRIIHGPVKNAIYSIILSAS